MGGTQSCPFVYLLSVTAFALQWQWNSCDKDHRPQSPTCLLSRPLQEKFTNTWYRPTPFS